MVRTNGTVHVAVIVLFAIAIGFYLAGLVSTGIALSVVGIVVEIVAWVTWFVTDSDAKQARNSGEK